MPALRTNTASGCWRGARRERESERRDGTAATNEFRQLPKIRPEIHHWRFPPISNLHSPGPNPPTRRCQSPIAAAHFVEARGADRRGDLADDRKASSSSSRNSHERRRTYRRENFAGTDTRRAGRREGSSCEAAPEGPTEAYAAYAAERAEGGNEADGPLSAP